MHVILTNRDAHPVEEKPKVIFWFDGIDGKGRSQILADEVETPDQLSRQEETSSSGVHQREDREGVLSRPRSPLPPRPVPGGGGISMRTIPEPASLALGLLATVGLVGSRRRRLVS